MKLIELEPRWIVAGGQAVGFVFRCPTRPDRWQTCFDESPPNDEQWALIRSVLPEAEWCSFQGCTPGTKWTIKGDFHNLTVTPSLDGSAGGNWHGHITNGEIVGGV